MAIKIKLEGFEDILQNIEAAGRSMASASESALKESAQIMQSELKSEMRRSNVPADLVDAMPPFGVETNGNRVTAKVGYAKGSYNPHNLSEFYKVLFLNYGTPNRKQHGQIHEGSPTKAGGPLKLGFVQRAKKSATPKIKKAQKKALEKILERLRK